MGHPQLLSAIDRPSTSLELHTLFENYEKRFRQAQETMPARRPWLGADRQEILEVLQRCLGIRASWIPEIRTKVQATSQESSFVIQHLQSRSWPNSYGSADLYLPAGSSPVPAVLLACGHAQLSKRGPAYRHMAMLLAKHGIAVLVLDNIGQGERAAMGHADAVDVFACGLSVQGLITMETIGWLRWMRAQPAFDRDRIAMIGNSGGGTLSMLAGALCRDELAAISSSGYPNTLDFIARKEKKHCHCNLLPHLVGELEMWQIYGCIAPTPLLMFQGKNDHLFPYDLFRHTARKVRTAYELCGADKGFEAHVVEGSHRWDAGRRRLMMQYLCEKLSVDLDPQLLEETEPLPELPPCYPRWPDEAKTVDEIARDLSGAKRSAVQHLWEVFKPQCDVTTHRPFADTDLRQILAQFEAFLT